MGGLYTPPFSQCVISKFHSVALGCRGNVELLCGVFVKGEKNNTVKERFVFSHPEGY